MLKQTISDHWSWGWLWQPELPGTASQCSRQGPLCNYLDSSVHRNKNLSISQIQSILGNKRCRHWNHFCSGGNSMLFSCRLYPRPLLDPRGSHILGLSRITFYSDAELSPSIGTDL